MNIITKTLIGGAVAAGAVASAVLGVTVANAAEPIHDTKAPTSQVHTDGPAISGADGSAADSTPAISASDLPAGSTIENGTDLGNHDGLSISGGAGTSASDIADAQPAAK